LEKNIFDFDQLKELGKRYKDPDYTRKILNARYQIFKKQIRTVNVEINQDRAVVSQKIKCYVFSDKFSEYLNSIDDFIRTDTSKVMNAGYHYSRSFMVIYH
jgi:hypothetical protein